MLSPRSEATGLQAIGLQAGSAVGKAEKLWINIYAMDNVNNHRIVLRSGVRYIIAFLLIVFALAGCGPQAIPSHSIPPPVTPGPVPEAIINYFPIQTDIDSYTRSLEDAIPSVRGIVVTIDQGILFPDHTLDQEQVIRQIFDNATLLVNGVEVPDEQRSGMSGLEPFYGPHYISWSPVLEVGFYDILFQLPMDDGRLVELSWHLEIYDR